MTPTEDLLQDCHPDPSLSKPVKPRCTMEGQPCPDGHVTGSPRSPCAARLKESESRCSVCCTTEMGHDGTCMICGLKHFLDGKGRASWRHLHHPSFSGAADCLQLHSAHCHLRSCMLHPQVSSRQSKKQARHANTNQDVLRVFKHMV